MTQVKNLAGGWRCAGCGRCWSPYIVGCPECAQNPMPLDERVAFLERMGYRKRIDRMVRTLEKAGV